MFGNEKHLLVNLRGLMIFLLTKRYKVCKIIRLAFTILILADYKEQIRRMRTPTQFSTRSENAYIDLK